MSGVADVLRTYVRESRLLDAKVSAELMKVADAIDAEHGLRMEQAKREVRRRMARDARWAITMLEARESRRHIREGIEIGERKDVSTT